MRLIKYSNLYAYYISHNKCHGSEVSLKYERRSKQYQVVLLKNFTVIGQFNTNDAFLAKAVFRRWV